MITMLHNGLRAVTLDDFHRRRDGRSRDGAKGDGTGREGVIVQEERAEYLVPSPRYRRVEVPLSPPSLRPYQMEAYRRFMDRRKGVLLMATGSGKTVVALHIIKALGVHTVVAVPTVELMWQWVREFRKWGDVRAGVWYGERKDVRPVMVMVYNSATLLLEDAEMRSLYDRFGLVVFDEIHHLGGAEFGKLKILIDGTRAVLGLTASLREGSVEHGRILSQIPIIYRFGVADALSVKAVAPIEVHPHTAAMNASEANRYDEFSKKIKNGMRSLRVHDITAIAQRAKQPGKEGWIARSVLSAITSRKMLMAHIRDKMPKVLEILRKHPGDRALVFSEAIEGIEGLEEYLRGAGVRTAVYHSDLPSSVRRMTLSDWGKGFDVLLSVRALDEGIDVPEVAVGILVASGRSERQLIQRIGRIIRPLPEKTAHIYVVYCPGTIEDRILSGVRDIVSRMSSGEYLDSSNVRIREGEHVP